MYQIGISLELSGFFDIQDDMEEWPLFTTLASYLVLNCPPSAYMSASFDVIEQNIVHLVRMASSYFEL